MKNSPCLGSRLLKLLPPGILVWLFLWTGVSGPGLWAIENPIVPVAVFSMEELGGLPRGWDELVFSGIPEHTRYRVVSQDNRQVLKAESRGSASGLIRHIRIDPRTHPVVHWRWRVDNIYAKGDLTQKKGDDYPARIYINFAFDKENASFFDRFAYGLVKQKYGEDAPFTSINYIWASKAPKGKIAPNPYTSQTMMIPVASGRENLGQWVEEKRNVFRDYQAAFGREPTMINSIAVMTDSDNTKESATAFYGEIWFSSEE
ncbi:DUF3047 domain-containing protein [Desulfospira joergensenii]|uniref:DUF3047 domain-containing protein n=1 Tax=Desulfospira joergensenii TaxID=53329 RepID=UPI00041A6E5F|nr:DUF3047 domain-containing protein [Desulfospira joergensenii]